MGFFFFQGTLSNPNNCSKIGVYGAYAPPYILDCIGAAHTQCFPRTITRKKLFTAYGTHRGSKKFFTKKTLTCPINRHKFPEKERELCHTLFLVTIGMRRSRTLRRLVHFFLWLRMDFTQMFKMLNLPKIIFRKFILI